MAHEACQNVRNFIYFTISKLSHGLDAFLGFFLFCIACNFDFSYQDISEDDCDAESNLRCRFKFLEESD